MRSRQFDGPVKWSNRSVRVYPLGFHWAHAARDGGPVLRGHASWRTLSGLLVNAPSWSLWLFWRRWGR